MESKKVSVSKGKKFEMMKMKTLQKAFKLIADAMKTLDVTHNSQSADIRNAFTEFYNTCKRYHKDHDATVKKLQSLLETLKATTKGTKTVDTACQVTTVVLLVGGVLTYVTPLGPFVAGAQIIGAISAVAGVSSALVKFDIDRKTSNEVAELLKEGKKKKDPLDKAFGALQKTLFDVIDVIMSKSTKAIKDDKVAETLNALQVHLSVLLKKEHKSMIITVDKVVTEKSDVEANVIFGTDASKKQIAVRSTVAMIKGSQILGRAVVPVGVIYDSYTLFDSATKKSKSKDELCVGIEAIIQGMKNEKTSFEELLQFHKQF